MATSQLRASLAETIASLDSALTPDQVADAVLASAAVASLQARAWDEGFKAGTRHARPNI